MNAKQVKGKRGEIEATKYLEEQGYTILCNNFRCKQGEIDIIAKDKEELVFIEVKTRSSIQYGEAREAVTAKKQKHIQNTAKCYLYQNKIEDAKVRMDVIEVYFVKQGKKIFHLRQAIE